VGPEVDRQPAELRAGTWSEWLHRSDAQPLSSTLWIPNDITPADVQCPVPSVSLPSNEAGVPTKPLVRLLQDVPLLLIGEVKLICHARDQNEPLYLLPDIAGRNDRLLHDGPDRGVEARKREPKLLELVGETIPSRDLIERLGSNAADMTVQG
jgi:hypothetical protein